MSKKTSSSELLAASNAASASPMSKRVRDRHDPTLAATQPSDEVMNALFEQVAVRSLRREGVYELLLLNVIIEKPKHDS